MAEAMGDGTGDPLGRALSSLLRAWWENSVQAQGRKPTQEALARQIGVTQATLSRYLSPAHPLMAPADTVRVLHAALGAPPEELEKAVALACGVRSEQRPTASALMPARKRRLPEGRGARRNLAIAAMMAGALIAVWSVGRTVLETGRTVKPVAAPAHPNATQWPLVRKGETSSLTWTVQRLLKAHHHQLRTDGIFGSETRAQVIAFQKKRGLQPDGKVGKDTWPMLVLPASPGDTGPQVEAVQDLLHRAGQPSDITGVYTAATQRMVRSFQRQQGLPDTGAVDEKTWLSLTSTEPT
ncbi:peptidoglycan-binding protein [Streptomyces sp. NPDC059215]|uniref:peptidoglycan-binding protein n=1 Tax=Streptomyces sp. NPDC059215 TaxID=3346772 RepID=UPI0036AB0FEF